MFQTHPQHPDKPLIEIDLALVLIPSLLLGTSIGKPILDYLRSDGPQSNCCLSSAASLEGLGKNEDVRNHIGLLVWHSDYTDLSACCRRDPESHDPSVADHHWPRLLPVIPDMQDGS